MKGPRVALALGLVVAGLFLVRAVTGWVHGVAYARGRFLAAHGFYEEALPHLDRAVAGHNTSPALWLAAQVRMGIWHDRMGEGIPAEELESLLEEAHQGYLGAMAASPASGWYWASLGDVYHQRERVERFTHGFTIDSLGPDRWSLVGRSGRLAIGMTRTAIEREPTVFTFHDQLAFMLFDYQLTEEALRVVDSSARVQPTYRLHAYDVLDPLPDDLLTTFVRASREELEGAPFLRRQLHLLSLGKVEHRRENYEQARKDFVAALSEAGDTMNRAEAHLWLGKTLTEFGRYEEAEAELELALADPRFAVAVARARIRIAMRVGRLDRALGLLRDLRRLQPRKLGHCLEFADVARQLEDWPAAFEALSWARVVHPNDRRPLVVLIETYLEAGQRAQARQALNDLVRMVGADDPDYRRLKAWMAGFSGT